MSSKDDIQIKFGADTKELETEINKVNNSAKKLEPVFKNVSNNIKNSFESVGKTFEELKGKIFAITAIVAGGSAFGEMINKSTETAAEIGKLSKALGVTAEQASVLRIALKDNGIETDTYLEVIKKLTEGVSSMEPEFNKMGIKTRDNNGKLLETKVLMDNSLAVLKSYKTGVNQNSAAIKLFTDNAKDVIPLLKVNNEEMERAAKKAQALGLIMGGDTVQANKEFKRSLGDLNDVFNAISIAIANTIMPALKKMSEFFYNIGPSAINVLKITMDSLGSVFNIVGSLIMSVINSLLTILEPMKDGFDRAFGNTQISAIEFFTNTLKGLEIVFLAVVTGLKLGFAGISYSITLVIQSFKDLASFAVASIESLKTLSLKPLNNAWDESVKQFEKNKQNFVKNIKEIKEESINAFDEIANRGTTNKTDKKPEIKKEEATGGTKEFKLFNAEAAALTNAKLQNAKINKENEIKIEQEKLKNLQDINQDNFDNKKINEEQYYAVKNDLAIKDFKLQKDLKNLEYELEKKTVIDTSKYDLVEQKKNNLLKIQGDINLLTEVENNLLKKNNRELTNKTDELTKQQQLRNIDRIKQDATFELDIEKQKQDELYSLGKLSEEKKLQLDKQNIQKEYEIEKKALQDKLELAKNDKQEREKIEDDIYALKQQNQLKLNESETKLNIESKKKAQELQKEISDSFENGLTEVIRKRKKWADFFADLRNMMKDTFAKSMSKSVTNYLFGQGQDGKKDGIFSGLGGLITGATSNKEDGKGIDFSKLYDDSKQSLMNGFAKSSDYISEMFGGMKDKFSGLWDTISNMFSSGSGGGNDSGIISAIGNMFSGTSSYAVGVANVPYDQFAKIHKDERILTAAENQQFKNGNLGKNFNITANFNLNEKTDKRTTTQMAAAMQSLINKR